MYSIVSVNFIHVNARQEHFLRRPLLVMLFLEHQLSSATYFYDMNTDMVTKHLRSIWDSIFSFIQ